MYFLCSFTKLKPKEVKRMKEPVVISNTLACAANTAIAFAAIGACTATAVYYMCGVPAVAA